MEITEKTNKKDLIFEYFVPIQSKAELDGDFLIEGIAINETVTSNGHKFLGEELEKSASTLVGVPLLKDHNNSVDSIVGRVKSAFFNSVSRNIPFKAKVVDPRMKEMIKEGLLNSVSVGAQVDPRMIEEDEDGNIVPRGIIFKELSLVAVPADSAATFGVALKNAWNGLKSHSNENLTNTERGSMNMTEETEKPIVEEETIEPQESEAVEPVEEPVEPVEEVEPEKDELAEVEEKIKQAKLELAKKELALLETKLSEADVDEVEDEESEDETVEEKAKYSISQDGNAFVYQCRSYI